MECEDVLKLADASREPYCADALIEGFPGNYAFPPEALDRESFTILELEIRGLQTDDYLLLWLKHPELNWLYRRMGMQSDEQPAGRLTLRQVLETPPTAKSVVARLQRQNIAGSQGQE